ncbi:hypothetical protein MSPP1_002184 [Malassezia sp. CBS 17886]|nr:hypothetical protein MSPP1_002184 [Malassezia sp. CBS 17886]
MGDAAAAPLVRPSTLRATLVLGAVALGSAATAVGVTLGVQRRARNARRRRLKLAAEHEAYDSATSVLPAQGPLPPGAAPAAGDMRDADALTPAAATPLARPGADVLTPASAATFSGSVTPVKHDEALIREQLSRNYSFFGEQGMQAIRDSFVVVVGAGGVGSWAALMLLRSGVGRLRLVDFDQVSLSSLNRHACATLADVGRPKVVCCAQYFQRVCPWTPVDACVDLFRADNADRLLHGAPAYVIDAIDNLDTKVELLKYCATHGLRVFSSMGAGAKADPSRIQISDISTTVEDPLARVVRRELRAAGVPPLPLGARRAEGSCGAEEGGAARSDTFASAASSPVLAATDPAHINAAPIPAFSDADFEQHWTIPCVYSTEKSDTRLLPLDDAEFDKGNVGELAAFDDFRVRVLPVLGPLPAMFGLAAATYILCDLANHKMEPLAVKGRRKLYEKLFADLNVTESRHPSPPHAPHDAIPRNRRALAETDVPPTYRPTHTSNERTPPPRVRIPFSVNDCAYLFEEMFRGRTVVPPFETLATGQLVRWDPDRALDYDNVVLFTRKQAREHEQNVLEEKVRPDVFWGPRVAEMVQRRQAEEKRMSHWR